LILIPDKPRFKREKICDAIHDLIINENLKTGDKLGAERELALKMNVQRLTVRRAIKQLCKEGVLEQRPGRGTYVKMKVKEAKNSLSPVEQDEATIAPISNILTSKPDTVLNFATNDIAPEQLKGWKSIFKLFSDTHPGIFVKHCNLSISQKNVPKYDCALVKPHDLHCNDVSDNEMTFPSSWFTAIPQKNFLSRGLVDRINSYAKTQNAYRAIPLMLVFSMHAVNCRLLEKYQFPEPPSLQDWTKTQKWLKESAWTQKNFLLSHPYTHSPLNHLCRQKKDILGSDQVNLSNPETKKFLQFLKELWERSELNSTNGTDLINLTQSFIEDKVLSLEIFSNLIPVIYKRSNSNMKFLFNSISASGLTQVLPRYLVIGNDKDKYYEILEFCQFLASGQAQLLIAQEGLGIPYYSGIYGSELFCKTYGINYDNLKQELNNANGFYGSIFFKFDFQNRIINPTLRSYFNNTLTLDQAIDSISSRTKQQFDLFHSNEL
jgi:DNA-binding transcriptional regulator YhcF (GntR family)